MGCALSPCDLDVRPPTRVSGDGLSVGQSAYEIRVDPVLLLESPAGGGADAELVDTLGVLPCGDSACQLDDGLGRWCAMADDGARRVKQALGAKAEAGDGLASND